MSLFMALGGVYLSKNVAISYIAKKFTPGVKKISGFSIQGNRKHTYTFFYIPANPLFTGLSSTATLPSPHAPYEETCPHTLPSPLHTH